MAFRSSCAVDVCHKLFDSATESDLFGFFSDLNKLLRFLVRVRRYVRVCLNRIPTVSVTGPLTAHEIEDAFLACIRLSQERTYTNEFKIMKNGERLPTRHPLLKLGAFIDANDILRVGGRLQNSILPFSEQHPPIISGECPLAAMIISWAHTMALHGGPRVTYAYVVKRAWIIGGQRRTKAFVHHCVRCARTNARPASQFMAPLPSSRVISVRAFHSRGIDYAGPFYLFASRGRGIRTIKAYVALFVCLTTKGIHLELIGDLTTESLLGALSRFSGRRGKPNEIWSDNATYFRRADVVLRSALRSSKINWATVSGRLAELGTEWGFIPPAAPHFGGLWEAGIKSIKGHLRRVVGSRHLTYKEFTTVLVGIEFVLNSRPLTPLTDDPDDLEVLTPAHFLICGSLGCIVEPAAPHERLDHLTHWNLVRSIRNQFWKRYSREYLNTLQQRTKWTDVKKNFAVGDLVIVLDATLLRPNGFWPLGRIITVHFGSDGLVRTVIVKTATGEYTRPITKLALLPVVSNISPSINTFKKKT